MNQIHHLFPVHLFFLADGVGCCLDGLLHQL